MMKKIGFLCIALTAGIVLPLSGKELILAENGKTAYRLKLPEKSNPVEKAAIQDLKEFLRQITGTQFPEGGSGPQIIIAGKPADDREPFAARERRIRTVGQDIYLYGEGEYGAAFAVYDFLEKKLGCRWFNMFGEMNIPRQKEVRLSPFSEKIIPSFETVEAGLCPVALRSPVYDFFRRNRMHIMPRFEVGEVDDAWQYIGPTSHTLGYYVPAGDIKGVRKGPRMGASPHLKDKKYFETNPEYFTLTEKGIRVPDRHYCFSHPGLRKTMTENIDLVLSKEYDPARKAMVCLDINDVNGPLCACPECKKLVEKYKAPGAPFFDYLMEMGNALREKYPRVRFKFIVYGHNMTLEAPDFFGKKFPSNLIPSLSGLTNDISKPYSSQSNKYYRENLMAWSCLSDNLAVIYTPVHWSFPSGIMSLAAGIRRLIEDMRLMHRCKVRYFQAHYSDMVTDTYNFKELQLYLLGRLGENIHIDAETLIRGFCDKFYGAASSEMYSYIRELDIAASGESHFYRWNSSPKVLSYVNPENVRRWQQQFDSMTDKVKNDPAALLHVNNARMDLDQNTVSIWRAIASKYPDMKKEVSRVAERYRNHFRKNAENRLLHFGKIGQRWTTGQINRIFARGIDFAEKTAHAKPLPKSFSHFPPNTVYEAFPEIENGVPLNDPDAAAGIAIEINSRKEAVWIAYQDNGIGGSVVPNSSNTKWSAVKISSCPPYHPDNLSEISKSADYGFYYLGRARITYDCSVLFRNLSHSPHAAAFAFGDAADPKTPDVEFDFYLSMKYVGGKRVRMDRMVAVRVQPGSKKAGMNLNINKSRCQ